MNLDFETLEKFLDEVEVQCLRCGSCCQTWSVINVPGYDNGYKPEQQLCMHCEPVRLDEQGQWHLATCKIHERSDYPAWCREFKIPSLGFLGGPCALGLGIWKARREQEPESKLPEGVEQALQQFEEVRKFFGR